MQICGIFALCRALQWIFPRLFAIVLLPLDTPFLQGMGVYRRENI
jgi:hypothetical protein